MILLSSAITTLLLPWYNNLFLYLFLITTIGCVYLTFLYIKNTKKYNNNILTLESSHNKKIDEINTQHEKKMESIRLEMLKREDDKNRMWVESEKETLRVLSGVSNLLDLSEKINKVESDKILKELDNIKNLINKK